jgi:hypothetical protein
MDTIKIELELAQINRQLHSLEKEMSTDDERKLLVRAYHGIEMLRLQLAKRESSD